MTLHLREARALVTACTCLAAAGCATIKEGNEQIIAIDTPGASGSRCVVGDKDDSVIATLTTPGSFKIKQRNAKLIVSCMAPGYERSTAALDASFNKRSRIQGPEGYLVDWVSGAMWRFPDKVDVTMIPATVSTNSDGKAQ